MWRFIVGLIPSKKEKRMKKILLTFCMLIFFPLGLQAETADAGKNMLDAIESASWNLEVKPLDFVYTLDKKRVFVLGADHKIYVYDPDGKKVGSVEVDKGVTAIDIAPRGESLYLLNSEKNSFTALDVSFVATIDIGDSPVLGNASAPVTMVIFSDFECPYCKKVQPMVEELLEKNPDTLKVSFKNFPLSMHQLAEPAARAALAAQKQGKFWEMHDALFAEKKLTMVKIIEAAQKLGLDMAQFNLEMNAPEIRKRLNEDVSDGRDADVTGTPALFINGRRVMDRNVPAMQKMIDQELQKAGGK